jgi:putative membrane protein
MRLLLGSLLLRPYVFLFLLVFLAAGVRDLGARRTALFLAWVWPLAFVAELASTRIGIPFGLYHYTGSTRGQELFIADVPFFDSLSFTFLAYAAFCLARATLDSRAPGRRKPGTRPAGRPGAPARAPLSPARSVRLALVSGMLMMLLDVVIDPLAVRGDRWFLGRIFHYPDGGLLFGVPLSNFAGWMLVGWTAIGGFLLLAGRRETGSPAPGATLYYLVLGFNLIISWWVREPSLFLLGALLHVSLFLLWSCYALGGGQAGRGVFSSSSRTAFDSD